MVGFSLPFADVLPLSRVSSLRALQPPGYLKQLHVGVRVKQNGKLVGFITGIPVHMNVYQTYDRCTLLCPLMAGFLSEILFCRTVPMVEINFLCVHKKLRSKRLAPVLIKEITRRTNLTGASDPAISVGDLRYTVLNVAMCLLFRGMASCLHCRCRSTQTGSSQ